jgi:FtsH-binding integral membrane protein
VTPIVINAIAIVLTIMVLSRIAGDNPLFRIAQYLFVGISLGLALVVAYHQVLTPMVRTIAGSTNGAIVYGIPLALGLLFFPRITRRQEIAWLANIPLALIFGVGAALALGGAIIGTLMPQILDTSNRPLTGDRTQIAGAIVLALGTVLTLGAFYYTAPAEGPRARILAPIAAVGHWLMMIAFGFFFASAVQSYMSALIERLGPLIVWLRGLSG